MRFRPRYSLLTLLLLTALFVGGVKLWRGPHRVRVGETLTTFEQNLLEQGQAMGFTTAEWQYEYDYVRSWQERRVMSVTCFPTSNYSLVIINTPDYRPGRRFLFSEENYHKYLNEDSLAASSKDFVHCWIQPGQESAERTALPTQGASPLPSSVHSLKVELAEGEEPLNSYLVTKKGKIYVLVNTILGIQYTKISLDQVADPDARSRIEEELLKLTTKG